MIDIAARDSYSVAVFLVQFVSDERQPVRLARCTRVTRRRNNSLSIETSLSWSLSLSSSTYLVFLLNEHYACLDRRKKQSRAFKRQSLPFGSLSIGYLLRLFWTVNFREFLCVFGGSVGSEKSTSGLITEKRSPSLPICVSLYTRVKDSFCSSSSLIRAGDKFRLTT